MYGGCGHGGLWRYRNWLHRCDCNRSGNGGLGWRRHGLYGLRSHRDRGSDCRRGHHWHGGSNLHGRYGLNRGSHNRSRCDGLNLDRGHWLWLLNYRLLNYRLLNRGLLHSGLLHSGLRNRLSDWSRDRGGHNGRGDDWRSNNWGSDGRGHRLGHSRHRHGNRLCCGHGNRWRSAAVRDRRNSVGWRNLRRDDVLRTHWQSHVAAGGDVVTPGKPKTFGEKSKRLLRIRKQGESIGGAIISSYDATPLENEGQAAIDVIALQFAKRHLFARTSSKWPIAFSAVSA